MKVEVSEMWHLLSLSDGRYVSVLNCITRDVIHTSAVYLRITFRLSNLTHSTTRNIKFLFFLLLAVQSVVKLSPFQSSHSLLSVLLLTSPVPQAHVLQIFLT